MLRPILLRLANIALWTWTAIKFALDWVGRSTVVEDFQALLAKLPRAVEFFYQVPWQVPALLAATVTGVLIYPDIRKLLSKQGSPEPAAALAQAPTDKSPTTSAKPKPEVEVPDEEPFGAGILGGPIGSSPVGTVSGSRLPSTPPRTDPETEHEDKKKAKESIVCLARDQFYPAWMAMNKLKAQARDVFLRRLDRKTPVYPVISRAIDHGVFEQATKDKNLNVHGIQSIDKVRERNFHEVTTDYYHNYIDYVRNAEIAISAINQSKPEVLGCLQNVKAAYKEWRDLHDKLIAANVAYGHANLDDHTISKMHENVKAALDEPDWDSLIPK